MESLQLHNRTLHLGTRVSASAGVAPSFTAGGRLSASVPVTNTSAATGSSRAAACDALYHRANAPAPSESGRRRSSSNEFEDDAASNRAGAAATARGVRPQLQKSRDGPLTCATRAPAQMIRTPPKCQPPACANTTRSCCPNTAILESVLFCNSPVYCH